MSTWARSLLCHGNWHHLHIYYTFKCTLLAFEQVRELPGSSLSTFFSSSYIATTVRDLSYAASCSVLSLEEATGLDSQRKNPAVPVFRQSCMVETRPVPSLTVQVNSSSFSRLVSPRGSLPSRATCPHAAVPSSAPDLEIGLVLHHLALLLVEPHHLGRPRALVHVLEEHRERGVVALRFAFYLLQPRA